MNFLIIFIILSLINVIFSTFRTILTVKSGKTIASIISGGYFAFYNVMLIYTVADFPMWQKCLITFVCNVIGVWVVKFIEEKSQKAKLWKVEATVSKSKFEEYKDIFSMMKVPHNYIDINKYTLVNFYCSTRKQSEVVKQLLVDCDAKYFVSESKTL